MFLKHKMKTQVEKRHQNPVCRLRSWRTWEKRDGSDGTEDPEIVAALASREIRMDEDKNSVKPSQQDMAVGMGKSLVTMLGIK